MNKQKIFYNSFSVLLIFGLTLYNIKNLDMITILNDEFGYWSNAAIITGNDWKSLMAETPYYSFGYSLLLVPLFFIFKDYAILYKSAILLNALLLVGTYFCVNYVVSNYLNVKNETEKFSLSIISVLTGSVIFQSQVGWPETLITFLMWASIALLVSIEKNSSVVKVIILALLCICMFTVHQRTIVSIIVCLGCLILILFHDNFAKKYMIPLLSCLVIGFLIYKCLKLVQISFFYGNSTASNLNNISVNGNFFFSYFTKLVSNFKLFYISFIGKITISLFMTYFTFPIVFYRYICDGIKIIKTKIKIEHIWIHTYIIFSFLGMLAATALQMINCTSRKDMVVYTRYFDFTVGPIIMLGIYLLISGEKKQKRLFTEVYLLYGVLVYRTFDVIKNAKLFFNVPCSPVYGGIMQYSKKISENIDWEFCKGIAMQFGVIIFLLIMLINIIKKSKAIYIYMACVLTVSQVFIAHYSNDWLDNARNSSRNNVLSLYEQMKEDDYDIYYIKDPNQSDYYVNPKFLQFILISRPIHVITWDEEAGIEEDSWVLVESSGKIEEESYVFVESTDTLKLYQKKGE